MMYAKATAEVMTYFKHGVLIKEIYDKDFVVSTMIPSIRHRCKRDLVSNFASVVQLNIPPHVSRCSLTPKFIKEALKGYNYDAQIQKENTASTIESQSASAVTERNTNAVNDGAVEDEEHDYHHTAEPASPQVTPASPVIVNEGEARISSPDRTYLVDFANELFNSYSSQLKALIQQDTSQTKEVCFVIIFNNRLTLCSAIFSTQ